MPTNTHPKEAARGDSLSDFRDVLEVKLRAIHSLAEVLVYASDETPIAVVRGVADQISELAETLGEQGLAATQFTFFN